MATPKMDLERGCRGYRPFANMKTPMRETPDASFQPVVTCEAHQAPSGHRYWLRLPNLPGQYVGKTHRYLASGL